MRAWEYVKGLFRHHFVPGDHNAYRPRILHRPWLLFFLAIILATEGFLVSNLIARQSNQQFLAAVVPAEIIALTNTERTDNGVGTLEENALLDSAAQAKADDMAANDYFSHVGPDGKTPWQWIDESGYVYQYAGENLAVRFVDSSDVVNAWMASPTHRANIVKPVYTQIGVGVADGLYQGEPATYVVQYFGTPQSIEPASVATVVAPLPQAPPVPANASTTHIAAAAALATPPPAVEGAETSAPPAVQQSQQGASFVQSFVKQVIRALSEPGQSVDLVLGLVASLLVIALFFAFFMHIQIQHQNMLAAGAFVAALALFFLSINLHVVGGTSAPQSASVVQAQAGVVISAQAAETGYALFPQ